MKAYAKEYPKRSEFSGQFIELFWSRVDKSGDCWLWTGCLSPKNYGRLSHDGRTLIVPRVAFILTVRDIASSECVLHKCDNGRCCNPDHLYAGTQADNMRDAIDRGRRPVYRGSANPMAKLTIDQAREIRSIFQKQAITKQELSDKFGVSRRVIRRIVSGIGYQE